jgi:predicted MFS family arabinose efflux permease
VTLTSVRPTPVPPAPLPWRALLALGAATLVMVTAEMLPTAVLAPMSQGLGVAESLTGQLVAAWALTVVVASLPLTRLTRRVDRRRLVVAGLVALALSSLATALAPSYGVVLGARLAGAAAVGLLWSTANAHVADLVAEELLGRAVAVVLGGATLGMVLGTPLARLIADVASWRVAFGVLALATLGVALLVRAVVPGRPRASTGPVASGPRGRSPLAPTLVLIALVGLLLVGFYGTYTFITRIGEPAAGLLPGGTSGLLLGFGLASAAGVAVAGRVGRTASGLVVASAATAAALLLLAWASVAAVGLLAILALGLVSGALPPLAQTEILRRAGTAHRDLAAALIPVVFNGGIAVGAAAASLLVGLAGHSALPVPAAATVAIAAVGLAVFIRRGVVRPEPRTPST